MCINMRITPAARYQGMPCSYVGTGCAYEDYYGEPFPALPSPELKEDGWLTLEGNNRYIRAYLPVRKKVYYKRSERPRLRDFLAKNNEKCGVCVYGHFIYVNGHDYWSFFDNDDDPVVCVWYLRENTTT